MRADQPGGAPNVGQKYKNVFRQVSHGRHTLTEYGQRLAAQIASQPASAANQRDKKS
jgi:hypothetical protein